MSKEDIWDGWEDTISPKKRKKTKKPWKVYTKRVDVINKGKKYSWKRHGSYATKKQAEDAQKGLHNKIWLEFASCKSRYKIVLEAEIRYEQS